MIRLLVLALMSCSDAPAEAGTAPNMHTPAPSPSTPTKESAPSDTTTEALLVKASPASCAFAALERFDGRIVKWEGECVEGKAHGKGVLRAYPKAGSADKAVLIFYGLLDRGDAKLGVLEIPDGYVAGEFRGGSALDNSDPDVTVRAFRCASEAATLVSERLKAAGNNSSAAFYAKKASTLQNQLN